MKKFRIYLRDGVTFTVEADRFEMDAPNKTVKFFRTKDGKEEEDKDIHILWALVIAIIHDKH